jgi:hypothetical protein
MTDLTMAGDHDGNDLLAIRREIVRVGPEFLAEPIAPLGEGMDNLAVLVGGAAVFRFAKHDDAAAGLRREIALLPRLARGLSLAIPAGRRALGHVAAICRLRLDSGRTTLSAAL